MIIFTLYFWGH